MADDIFKEIEQELDISDDETGDIKENKSEIVEISTKKNKRPLSEKAKQARIANLAKGRELRKKNVQERKRLEQMYNQYEYDEDSEEEDEIDFTPRKAPRQKGGKKLQRMELELQAMKNIVSKLSKKKDKQVKQPVVINNQIPVPQASSASNNDITDTLKSKILRF